MHTYESSLPQGFPIDLHAARVQVASQRPTTGTRNRQRSPRASALPERSEGCKATPIAEYVSAAHITAITD